MAAKKLLNLHQLLMHEYSDGTVRMLHQRLDQVTRRVVPDQLFVTVQTEACRWTPPELLFIGAAELLQRETGHPIELPF